MPSRPVVLRDIAREASVSVATVSMALRNSPLISETRREQIQAIARQMGYVPNPAMSALASYRRARRPVHYRENLAFLYQLQRGETSFKDWENWPIRKGLLEGMRQRSGELGYKIECHELPREAAPQRRLAEMLGARGIRGILVHANMQPVEEALRAFSAFALLSMIDFCENAPFHQLRSNDYEVMRLALLQLRRRGYRRPLYLKPGMEAGRFGPEKLSALAGIGEEFPEMRGRWMDEAEFLHRGMAELRGRDKPDVLLIHNHLALEAAAKRHGWSLPREMAVCHLFASGHLDHYAGVDIRPALMGNIAIDVMDGLLCHGEIGFTHSATTTLVDPVWIDGPSVPETFRTTV